MSRHDKNMLMSTTIDLKWILHVAVPRINSITSMKIRKRSQVTCITMSRSEYGNPSVDFASSLIPMAEGDQFATNACQALFQSQSQITSNEEKTNTSSEFQKVFFNYRLSIPILFISSSPQRARSSYALIPYISYCLRLSFQS